MSHPPFAPAAKAAGAFCVVGEFEGARHGRKNPAPRTAAPDLQYSFFYGRECDPNFKPRAPVGRGGEREAQILCDLAREIEPHAGGFVLLVAGVSGEAFFKCSCTVRKQATENKR